jgi:hypothetical protein
VFLGQLSGDDFTNSSTRQEPQAVLKICSLAVSDGLQAVTATCDLSTPNQSFVTSVIASNAVTFINMSSLDELMDL